MVYSYKISVPANTAETDAQVTELPLTRGKLHRLFILIPAGHRGLAHLQLYRGLHQVFPISPGESISGDEVPIAIDPGYEISETPYQLEAHTWNTDDTYEHKFYLIFGVKEREAAVPKVVQTAADILAKLRG